MSLPRISRISFSDAVRRSWPLKRILPEGCEALGYGSSFRIDSALTDFPEPDSPTSATHSPRLMENETWSTASVLPNAMVATMTFLPFIVSSSVMTLTALDFLGFGLPPGSPSLGELLSQGKANVQAPWLGFTGFFAVAIMLSLLIFIGEAVRDAFDPRKTFR